MTRAFLAALGALLLLAPAAQTAAADDAAVSVPEDGRQILVVTRLPPPHFRAGGQYGGSYRDRQARLTTRKLAARIAREAGLRLVDDWPLPLIEANCFVMAVPEGRSVEQVVAAVSGDPDVVFAEPMQVYETQAAPAYDDPMYPAQPLGSAWPLSALHRVSTGRSVKVAVIDSGVERAHPDLAGTVTTSMNFVAGHPFAAERHGTGIAGVIGAKANNGAGIVGIAPGAQLMALRACWQRRGAGPALCDTLSLAKALHFAIDHRAGVINLSLAGPRAELLDRLLDKALAQRISVVAAYDQALPGGGFPASKPGVIAVADETLARPRAGVYIAPGQDVITTEPSGTWGRVSGSSFSAAYVSGLFALLRSARAAPALVTTSGAIDACATLARSARLTCADPAALARSPR